MRRPSACLRTPRSLSDGYRHDVRDRKAAGPNITPSDIAQVLKYRDQEFFADITGNIVRQFFQEARMEPRRPHGSLGKGKSLPHVIPVYSP